MSTEEELAESVSERLGLHLPELDRRLRQRSIHVLAARVVALTDGQVETDLSLVPALVGAAAEAGNHAGEIRRQARALGVRHEAARGPLERKAIVRETLEGLGTSRADLVGDLRALGRHLDLETLLERFAARISEQLDIQHVAYVAAAAVTRSLGDERRRLDADALLEIAFEHVESSGTEAVVVGALSFAKALVSGEQAGERLPLLGAHRFRRAQRFAGADGRGPYVQVAALELCVAADPARACDYVRERIAERGGRDGMVVRRAALRVLGEAPASPAEKLNVARMARDDPSDHVRQGLARLLASLGTREAFAELERSCLEQAPIQVRGAALRELARRASSSADAALATERAVTRTLDELATRELGRADGTLVDVLVEIGRSLACGSERVIDRERVAEGLRRLLENPTLGIGVAERVGALLLAIEVRDSPRLFDLEKTFEKALAGLHEGERVVVEFFPETPRADLEKALAVACQDDLPVSLASLGNGRYRLTFGERRKFRLWRFLYEIVRPAPDKRLGFSHSTGRKFDGEVTVAPSRMGEVTPTRVPGERHLVSELGTWGQFLPRVDDLLAASRPLCREARVVTSVGTLKVEGPWSLAGRVRAYFRLSFGYARYAEQRDVSLAAREPEVRIAFVKELEKLGFRIGLESSAGRIGTTSYDRAPAALGQYLGARGSALPAVVPPWLAELGYTLAAPRANTAWHLALVVWLVLAGLVLRAAAIRARIERNLKKIPLRIGGWGSRGKSGSERIKAALFHALRFDVVVKTTGCEAMLIHARRDREARELFLYRPYDKATIWEQEKVVGFAARLGADVFLWECMALQPRFVGILMDEWMKEAIATLTNAYPDHEDIMGPSGEDVARVIGCFMPTGGVAFSAEEQMLPLIRDAARRRKTKLHEVSPLDAALLPRDLLARYPYAEHPANIAMVLALAVHLGVDRDWALVKMADHVVPDLGVLKTYPTVTFSGRRLTFSNGMSANERAGFLSNWTRLRFDELDGDREPSEVSVLVVNNRADRVPRSHVFAHVVARDAICDHVVLIGTNLQAMRRFILDEFEAFLATLSLGDAEDPKLAMERSEATLRRLRISKEPETLRKRLECVLVGAGATEADASVSVAAALEPSALVSGELSFDAVAEALGAPFAAQTDESAPGTVAAGGDVRSHIARLVRHYAETRALLGAMQRELEARRPDAALELLRAHCRKHWDERILVVADSHATGDQVIELVALAVPPGHHARLLGCQNIKGTGLDFAYRWVSIGQVHAELERLEGEPSKRESALGWLRAHDDYGLLDAREALRRVGVLAGSSDASWAEWSEELELLVQHLARVEAARATRLRGAPVRSRLSRILDRIEPLVDHLDSIRRSRRADGVMRDLFDQRVSQGRAAVLLRDLVARGKGGWLAADLVGKAK